MLCLTNAPAGASYYTYCSCHVHKGEGAQKGIYSRCYECCYANVLKNPEQDPETNPSSKFVSSFPGQSHFVKSLIRS